MKLSVNGREAYAYTGGKPFDPALPTVVLLHGALNDHSVWGLQARSLANHGRSVLALDLPGHGRSAGPALESVEAVADWVVALLDAAGASKAALVGHSMGSLIALEAASRLGERATQLVMVGTAYPMKVSSVLLDTSRDAPGKAIDLVAGLSLSTLLNRPTGLVPGTWLHGSSRALMNRLQDAYAAAGHGNLFHHDFGLCDAYAGAATAAEKLRCPVSFVLGARDQMTLPKMADDLAKALKARVVTVPAGHALMGEAPDGVTRALAEIV